MILVPGNYIGDGNFRVGIGLPVPFSCSLQIDNRGEKCRITGYWEKNSGSRKNSVSLFISKESNSDIKGATIEFHGESLTGTFFSANSFVNGVFSDFVRSTVIGVMLMQHEKGIRVIGSLIVGKKIHFDLHIHNIDPVSINSNILSFQKRA